MAVSSVTYNKPILPRTTDTSDLGSNRASVYSGKALDFDGVNDYVLVNDFGFDPLDLDFTLSTYVRVDTLKDGKIAYAEKGSNDSQLAAWQIRTDGNSDLYFQVNTTGWQTITWSGFSAQIKDETVHLTFIRKGTTVDLYLNGSFYATGTGSIPATLSSANGRFCIGNRLGASNYLDGLVSSYKIFNVALTADQVLENYSSPEKAVPTGVDATSLVLHFPMTEGNGSYLYNANQGALGTELISNGGFDETCQKWGTTDSNDVEIVNGKAIWTNAPLSGSFVKQPLDLEIGKFYRVSFDYTSTAFNIFVNLGDTQQAVPLGKGRASFDMYYGSGDSSLSFQHGYLSASSATVDNVSVKEVVPTYITGTINGATWVSGLPEPLPQTALMDWNSYERQSTEDNLDYYQGTLTIPTNNGTIVFKHVTDPLLSDNKYIFGLGTSTLGLSRAIRLRSTGKYGFVSFGSGNEDFDTSVSYTPGKPTTFALSWDETKYVNIYSDGLFAQSVYKSGLNNLSGSRTLRLYGSNFNANSNRGTIIYWAYYNRVLTATEINDINTGKVEPTDVDDLEYYFTHQNGYSYNGVTLTKTGGDFDKLLIPSGSTSGKDVFGNTISNPRASGAYNFDGASWAEVDDNASLDITDAITLECWFYWNNITSKGIFGRWHQDSNNRNYLLWKSSDTRVDFYINGSTVAQYYSLNATKGWTHIVGVYDRNIAKIYIDGVNVASSSHSLAITTGTMPLEIGRNFTTVNQAINSQLATPRIYNYALTAEQVADNYNQKVSTFGGTKATSEMDAYIARTVAAGATVEAHSCVINYLTELDKK